MTPTTPFQQRPYQNGASVIVRAVVVVVVVVHVVVLGYSNDNHHQYRRHSRMTITITLP